MNSKVLNQVADLLMYRGPSIGELISSAIKEGNDYSIDSKNGLIELTVSSTVAYDLKITDQYFFDDSGLVKQLLFLNNNEKVVFNKYEEAAELLKNSEDEISIAS